MEIFARKYYELFTDPPKNILEIGSRDAMDATILKKSFNLPDDKVYIVEPNPPCAAAIRLMHPKYKLFEFAISDKIGVVDFNSIISDNIGVIGSSSLLKKRDDIKIIWGDNYTDEGINNWIKVLSITGKMLLDLIGDKTFDVVKIDVEGVTFQVLNSFGIDIKKIKYLHIEVEEEQLWENQITHQTVGNYLIDMGFVGFYEYSSHPNDKACKQHSVVWYNKLMQNNHDRI